MILVLPSFWVRLLGLVLLVLGSAASSAQFIGAAARGQCHEPQGRWVFRAERRAALRPGDAAGRGCWGELRR